MDPVPTATVRLPDWLRIRDGALVPALDPTGSFVIVDDRPLYLLEIRPAAGVYSCAVKETVSGRRLDDATRRFPTAEAALAGGLEQLREALGW